MIYFNVIIRQCSARFLSAGELKGHQVMHTGDRKFPCRYCERAYVNYSGRLRHERTHTNERPFVCTQCGKGFTNSYILKNHMLVHTGERMFRKVITTFKKSLSPIQFPYLCLTDVIYVIVHFLGQLI